MPITPSGDFISVEQEEELQQLAADHEAALLAAENPDPPRSVVDHAPVEHARHAVEVGADVERCYVMLEQHTLGEMLLEAVGRLETPLAPDSDAARALGVIVKACGDKVVFEQLGPRVARNAEHAYRLIAKERLGDQPGRLNLVAVAQKMWKPKPVSSNVRQNFSVG